MKKVAFLACETTVPTTGPGAAERRGDAHEHDLMVAAVQKPFAKAGLELSVIDWEAPLEAFDGIALAMLGTAWNYQDQATAFLDRLDALDARGITICNPPDLVRWNLRKTYLRELAAAGARTIPTIWLELADAAAAQAAMDELACDRLIVKRQVGAGALGQELLERGNVAADWQYDHAAMLQPFLPAIVEEGELSFVFIEGTLSHALRKRPAAGDYRIQSLYGGREEVHEPTDQEAAAADAIMAAVPFPTPLYARIDMLRMPDGGLAVMEAELIEPYLYPEQGPMLGERLATAIANRIR